MAKSSDLDLLEDGLRKTMLSKSGPELDAALTELGWAEMLSDMPDVAVPMVFRLLGETGSHSSVLNDVVLQSSRRPPGGIPVLPFAGGIQVVWERAAADEIDQWVLDNSTALDVLGGLPLRRVDEGDLLRLAEGRRALAWWLVGSARAMLSLARQHALDRVQFGKPIASFQAVRHRLAETLVAIEGAEATLGLPGDDNPDLTALLAKAAAGKAALTAAQALPAGARRYRLHRGTRSGPSCEAGAGSRRIARQLTGTHPQGRSGPAGPRLGPAPRQPLRSPSSASVRVCTSTRRISPVVDARSRSCARAQSAVHPQIRSATYHRVPSAFKIPAWMRTYKSCSTIKAE